MQSSNMTTVPAIADATVSSPNPQLSLKKEKGTSPPAKTFDPLSYGTKPEDTTSEDGDNMEVLTKITTSDYPHAFKLAAIVIALVLSIFLVALDMTIVATAIPHITDEFHSLNQVGWYGSAFFLTLGAFQSTWGKAYKYFHLKPSFLVAIAIFELGSLICGVAQDSTTLIIGRAIAGMCTVAHLCAQRLTASRHGRSRHRFWRIHHYRLCSATSAEACVYWPSWGLIWMCQCYRSSTRRGIHFSCYMALVLLCQFTHRRCFCTCDISLFPGTRSFKARQGFMARKASSDGSTRHFHHHGSDRLLPACTPMGWCDQSLERSIGHWDTCRLRPTPDSLRGC